MHWGLGIAPDGNGVGGHTQAEHDQDGDFQMTDPLGHFLLCLLGVELEMNNRNEDQRKEGLTVKIIARHPLVPPSQPDKGRNHLPSNPS